MRTTRFQPIHRGQPTPTGLGPRGRQGFSLIEMIGVLVVMTILALAILPSLMSEYDRLAKEKERTAMKNIAEGLRNFVLNTRQIPGSNAFHRTVADEIGWLLSDVAKNGRKQPRYVLINPSLRIGTNASQVLPYTQDVRGSIRPARPQIILISSLGVALPSQITSPGGAAQEVFDKLWNAADDATPPGWTYGGRFDHYCIQRINLDPLFVQVTLNNNSPSMGHYSIDAVNFATEHIALPSNPFTNYFIIGTVLGLHSTDGTLQAKQILQEDCQYWYDHGVWRAKLPANPLSMSRGGADCQNAFDIFMSGPANPNAKFGVTQGQVTTDMYLFMSNYIVWATNGFSSTFGNQVQSKQTALADDTKNYIFKAGK